MHTGQVQTRGIGKLVYIIPIATKRVLVTLTCQLVVAQRDAINCSQLAELGWDETCESRTMSSGGR